MAKVTSRSLALDMMCEVALKKEPLDALLPALYEADLSAPDKGFARQLIMMTLRHHGQLGALIDGYLERPLEAQHVRVHWLMRMGAAQLLLLETPPHAAIDTSVQLCKQLGFVHQAGLVNAVLRKLSAEKPDMPPAEYNLSSWLKGAWRKAYGREACAAIAEQCLREPPLDITCKEGFLPEGEALLALSYRVPAQDVTPLPGYDEGAFWVQDVAASLPVRALGDVKGKRVLDLCAAPGGKTLQLCAGGAEVIAVDKSAPRLKRIEENLARCQFSAQLIKADLTEWQPEGTYDAVLLDAPCSATGTVRRHPDIWLRKSPKDMEEMVALQRAILTQVMAWLPAGVPLIYAVCSLQPEEGEQQIDWLLEAYPELRVEPIDAPSITSRTSRVSGVDPGYHLKIPDSSGELPGCVLTPEGYLRTLPHYLAEKGGMDGFFVAKLIY